MTSAVPHFEQHTNRPCRDCEGDSDSKKQCKCNIVAGLLRNACSEKARSVVNMAVNEEAGTTPQGGAAEPEVEGAVG